MAQPKGTSHVNDKAEERLDHVETVISQFGERLSTLETLVEGVGRDVGSQGAQLSSFIRDYQQAAKPPWATLIGAGMFIVVLTGGYSTLITDPMRTTINANRDYINSKTTELKNDMRREMGMRDNADYRELSAYNESINQKIDGLKTTVRDIKTRQDDIRESRYKSEHDLNLFRRY